MERYGVRRIAALALVLIGAGTGLTVVMNAAWQLAVLWGVLVGLGTGATALVFGALVANRWFVERRGLVIGLLGAAWATGQLVFLPLPPASSMSRRRGLGGHRRHGVRPRAFVLVVIRDRPGDVGLRLTAPPRAALEPAPAGRRLRAAAARPPSPCWRGLPQPCLLLAATFFVCG
jgi:MFS family permease